MKPNLKYIALYVSSLMLLFMACKKNNPAPAKSSTPPVDVYVAGISGDTSFCWVDGDPTYLTDGSRSAYAHSIYVTGNNDIYVAGEEFVIDNLTDQFMATSWKNGQITFLTTGQQTPISSGNSIFVSGNDVYVGGSEYKNGSQVATYWKNGVTNVVGPMFSSANSIFVSGTDVYLAGSILNDPDTTKAGTYYATYWKNGTPISLTSGTTAGNIASIVTSGGHVYAAGYAGFADGRHAAYWTDTTIIKLTNSPVGSFASSICVSASNVFVAGYQNINGTNVATYWKNNVPVTLSTKNSNALSIFVLGSDIYVAGYEDDSSGQSIATYWKNGVATHVGHKGSTAYSIFAKSR